jgi:hypothetical protein
LLREACALFIRQVPTHVNHPLRHPTTGLAKILIITVRKA